MRIVGRIDVEDCRVGGKFFKDGCVEFEKLIKLGFKSMVDGFFLV